MTIQRRNFVKLLGISVAAAVSNMAYAKTEGHSDFQAILNIQMPAPDGKYVFHVDGQKQTVGFSSGKGSLKIPEYACAIDYLAEDGVSPVYVYIDAGTTESSLLPGWLPGKASAVA